MSQVEALRNVFARNAAKHSAMFKVSWLLYKISLVAWHEGLATALKAFKLTATKTPDPVAFNFRKLQHPILLRPNSSDLATAIINFVHEEYSTYAPRNTPIRLIDCGAYIGDSSAYFLSKYPEMKSIALEPEPENFELASRNLAPYGERVTVLNRAIASAPGTVYITGAHDRARIDEAGTAIDAVTIPNVLDSMGWDRASILKMDVEGAEAAIFGPSASDWLQRVDFIVVEVHNAEAEAAIRQTMHSAGWSIRVFRSLWFCERT